MSISRISIFTVVLILAICDGVYGQSGEQSASVEPIQKTSKEPQIALRLKFFEVRALTSNESVIAELSGKQANVDSAKSQNENRFAHSTERVTQILDDLTKTGEGKIHSEAEIMLTPGVQSRYRRGREIDYAEPNPTTSEMIEITDTVDSGSTANPANKDSKRLVGTTILATATIESDQIVTLALHAKYTEFDHTMKSKFPGLKTQSSAITVAVEKDRSVILIPWRSTRTQLSMTKVPVLRGIPVIGAAFTSRTETSEPLLIFVLATTEIVQR